MNTAVFLSGYKNCRLLRNKLDITKVKPKEYEIERALILGKDAFIHFREHLLEPESNIQAYKDEMFIDANGVWHVLLLCSTCSDIMLLVNSAGKNYAKYCSIISNGGEKVEPRFTTCRRYNKKSTCKIAN